MAFTVAYQGEPGAYSEEAIRRVFPDAERDPQPTFEDVFAAVVDGEPRRGLVPIENAVFGSVRVNYDHLRAYPVTIIGESQLRIRHCLLASPGVSLGELEVVRSHQQALGQCRQWLRTHVPQASTQATFDTAGAARAVAEADDATMAAIASRRAADVYGLAVVAEDLEDDADNFTRFLVIAANDANAPVVGAGATRTSIVFVLQENLPGGLYTCLGVFASRGIDLLKVESRPLVGQPGQYRFYLDVDGARSDPDVAQALAALDERTRELQILGTYPQGTAWTT